MRKKLVLNWKNIQRKIDFCQKLISQWVFEPFLQCQFWVAGYTPICNPGLAVPAASLRDSSSNASGLNWQAQTFKMPPVCSLSNEWDKINLLSSSVSTKIPSLGLLDRLWARHLYRDKAAINSRMHFDSLILNIILETITRVQRLFQILCSPDCKSPCLLFCFDVNTWLTTE